MTEGKRFAVFIPSKHHVHDSIAENKASPVDEWFMSKYCSECSLDEDCKHFFNPHCHKVVEDHQRTVIEIAKIGHGIFTES